MNYKKYFLVIIEVIIFIILCSCSSPIDERTKDLQVFFKQYESERYDINSYYSSDDELHIEVWYNYEYFSDLFNDLLEIKSGTEKYLNYNYDLYSESYIEILCIGADQNIDLPDYECIRFYNQRGNYHQKININIMELNRSCTYEQFENLELNISELKIGDWCWGFECEVLTHFPKLKKLTIPAALCESDECVKSKVPDDCLVVYEYKDGSLGPWKDEE